MSSSLPLIAIAALLFNALIWGVSWWPFRLLETHGLHPLWSTALAYALAVVVALAVRPWTWREFWRGRGLVWLALAAGLCNAGFNWAVTQGDVVRVVLLFYLMPVWSLLLAWPLLGERPTAAGLARLLVALAGVVVVLKTPDSPWPVPQRLTDGLAIAAGMAFALTTLLLRKLDGSTPPARMFAMFGGGAVMAAAVALAGTAWGVVGPVPPLAPGWLLVTAAMGLALMAGNACLQFGAARLAASTTSLVMVSEVAFASLSAVALGAARVNGPTLMGGGLILLAVLLASWAESQPKKAPP